MSVTVAALQDIKPTQLGAWGGSAGLCRLLGSDPKKGLTDAQAATNRSTFGPNTYPKKPARSFLSHLLEAFEDETIKILIASAIFTVGVGLWQGDVADTIQGVAIVAAAIIVSGVNSYQNWSKDKEFKSLQKLREEKVVAVIRGGVPQDISIHDVVVGDLLLLDAVMQRRDKVACDGILIEGNDVSVDQSANTGESEPVDKEPFPAESFVLNGGSDLKEGRGVMLATAVGETSKLGRVLKDLEEEEETETPLQLRLDELAGQIGKYGTMAGVLTAVALILIHVWGLVAAGVFTEMWAAFQSAGLWSVVGSTGAYNHVFIGIGTKALKAAVVGITIVVVAVPEGLPLAVTLSLAYSMSRMMKDNNYVRRLDACETMGSATVIASDKTGTLTENRMRVVQAWISGASLTEITPAATAAAKLSAGLIRSFCRTVSLACYTTEVRHSTARVGEEERITFVGNPSEGAMLLMTDMLGQSSSLFRANPPAILAERLFRKEEKYASIVYAGEGDAEPFLVVKGAPERVLAMCGFEQNVTGQAKAISPQRRSILGEEVAAMASSGYRVLALAQRILPSTLVTKCAPNWSDAFKGPNGKAIEADLVLVGLVGIEDPLREGVKEAVEKCQEAGIRVIMVTGDHPETARSIARQAGILPDERMLQASSRGDIMVMEGADFRLIAEPAMEEDEKEEAEKKAAAAEGRDPIPVPRVARARLQKVVSTLAVLARSAPFDKKYVVKALQWNDEVVAVTGDGTNDALALKAADVGLAMGIAGTEVAKDAADIIILDDCFSSIVASVKWGRSIKENIRKFLTFQLTINIVALSLTFIAAVRNREAPLNPVMMLWVNMIMDSFAALALATEPPSDDLLKHKPGGKSEPLITSIMKKNFVGHAVFQTILLVFIYMCPHGVTVFNSTTAGSVADFASPAAAEAAGVVVFGSSLHRTLTFNAFIALQLFNLFNCRAVHDEWNILAGFSKSVVGQVILAIIVGMQVLMVQFGGEYVETTPLSLAQWGRCIAIGSLSIPVGYILKLIPAVDAEIRELGEPAAAAPAPFAGEGCKVKGAITAGLATLADRDNDAAQAAVLGAAPRASGKAKASGVDSLASSAAGLRRRGGGPDSSPSTASRASSKSRSK